MDKILKILSVSWFCGFFCVVEGELFRWIMLSVMISDSSRDYALSHLQYSKTVQTNHNLGILHSPGDSEKMPSDVFIDWRFKLVESKNIGRTLNLCIWAVLSVTSRHVLRWKTPQKHQVITFYQHTWHCQTIHCSRMCLTQGHCFFKKYLPEYPYCKFCPFWRRYQKERGQVKSSR